MSPSDRDRSGVFQVGAQDLDAHWQSLFCSPDRSDGRRAAGKSRDRHPGNTSEYSCFPSGVSIFRSLQDC